MFLSASVQLSVKLCLCVCWCLVKRAVQASYVHLVASVVECRGRGIPADWPTDPCGRNGPLWPLSPVPQLQDLQSGAVVQLSETFHFYADGHTAKHQVLQLGKLAQCGQALGRQLSRTVWKRKHSYKYLQTCAAQWRRKRGSRGGSLPPIQRGGGKHGAGCHPLTPQVVFSLAGPHTVWDKELIFGKAAFLTFRLIALRLESHVNADIGAPGYERRKLKNIV